MRRGMLAAVGALVIGLAYAAISAYWALGGTWLLDTVGIALSKPGQAGRTAALLTVWAAAVVKAIAAVLPVVAAGGWHRVADRGWLRPVRVLAWTEAVILTGYGSVLTATGLLVQGGVIAAAPDADRQALRWHAYLWDPWFGVWGILVVIALRRSRPRPHTP
jgi:Protein of unknown function (DUF3995)